MKKYVLAFIFIIYWIPSLAQSELKKIEGELFHTEEELFVDSVGNIYSSKFIIIVKEHFLDDVNKKDGIQVADLSSTFKGMKEILEHVESVLGSFELKRKFPEIEVDATLVSDKWGKKVNIHDYSKVFELNFNSPVSYNELNEKLSREENIISLDYPIIGMLTSSDPNDTFYDNQYGLTLINAEKVFNIASGDTNIILGFSDLFNSVSSNGVHEDLSGRFVAAEGGKKYVGSGSLGHGTTVSMVAAASTNNNKGLASMGGDFKLATNDAFNVDYFHSLCTATPTSPNCPDVINMSWVTSYNTLTKNKIEDLLDIGVVVVSASVNDLWYTLWPGQDTIGQPFKPFPAYLNFPTKGTQVISTTATQLTDTDGSVNPSTGLNPFIYEERFRFEDLGTVDESIFNYGLSNDPINNPDSAFTDLGAPGAYYFGTNGNSANHYGNIWGATSNAAPHVTATVGMMLSVNPNLTPSEVYDILIETANYDDIVVPPSSVTNNLSNGLKYNKFIGY